MSSQFPSMKPKKLLKKLRKLGFEEEASSGGSHRWVANGTIRLRWAFHDGVSIPPMLVKKILMKDIGLSEDEAKELLS